MNWLLVLFHELDNRESMSEEEKETFWRNTQCIIEKDVVRTDRSHPYFKGEDNPNIEILKYVLHFLFCSQRQNLLVWP